MLTHVRFIQQGQTVS